MFGLACALLLLVSTANQTAIREKLLEATVRQERTTLDPTRHSFEARELQTALGRRIVGQEASIRAVVDMYQVLAPG